MEQEVYRSKIINDAEEQILKAIQLEGSYTLEDIDNIIFTWVKIEKRWESYSFQFSIRDTSHKYEGSVYYTAFLLSRWKHAWSITVKKIR